MLIIQTQKLSTVVNYIQSKCSKLKNPYLVLKVKQSLNYDCNSGLINFSCDLFQPFLAE